MIDVITQPDDVSLDPAQGYQPLVRTADRRDPRQRSDFVTGMNRGRIDMATPYLRELSAHRHQSACGFVPIGRPPARPNRPVPRGKCAPPPR